MQVQADIDFDNLLKIVRTLPPGKIKLLKAELAKKKPLRKSKSNLQTLLLNGPIATKKQLAIIEGNRKAINQWRTK